MEKQGVSGMNYLLIFQEFKSDLFLDVEHGEEYAIHDLKILWLLK